MHISIYIFIYIHIYLCTYLSIYIFIYVHIYLYTYLSIYIFIYIHIYKHHAHMFCRCMTECAKLRVPMRVKAQVCACGFVRVGWVIWQSHTCVLTIRALDLTHSYMWHTQWHMRHAIYLCNRSVMYLCNLTGWSNMGRPCTLRGRPPHPQQSTHRSSPTCANRWEHSNSRRCDHHLLCPIRICRHSHRNSHKWQRCAL